ncbi:MAG: ornithine cyclodeaminase family protein [Maricaulaceae bacterium]|jgi:ornithine cyclodeaminase/alanine dehydrogenase-like protein (mu-crystallin family)
MNQSADFLFLDADAIRERLSIADCIPLVREAMIALSDGTARQLLRSFIPMGPDRTFAQMPAALSERGYFGAKMVSVFADPSNPGHKAHRGVVLVFEGELGRPVCLAEAGEVTRIRTAAASALATDVLARKDASVLAILGAGLQARAHIEAIGLVRNLSEVRVWGRNLERAEAFASDAASLTQAPVHAATSVQSAVEGADIVCTVTTASDPFLEGAWIGPGTHVNAVGSSAPGPAEIDNELVAKSAMFVDHKEHVVVHGGEFLRAKAAGLVTDDHIRAEIGEVLTGAKSGRTSDDEITLYKSLGHAVQDIAAVGWLYEQHQA